jgi:hypothetical protein
MTTLPTEENSANSTWKTSQRGADKSGRLERHPGNVVFTPNRSLGFYEGVRTGQEHLGFVLQHNRLFPAEHAEKRRIRLKFFICVPACRERETLFWYRVKRHAEQSEASQRR